MICRFMVSRAGDADPLILGAYGALGAILGHDFPFYLKGRGGKGMACTAGLVIGEAPILVPPLLLVFVLPLLVTRYVSLSSILVSLCLPVFAFLGRTYGFLNIPDDGTFWEFMIILIAVGVLNIIKHRANIVRLIRGNESKLGHKDKEK